MKPQIEAPGLYVGPGFYQYKLLCIRDLAFMRDPASTQGFTVQTKLKQRDQTLKTALLICIAACKNLSAKMYV